MDDGNYKRLKVGALQGSLRWLVYCSRPGRGGPRPNSGGKRPGAGRPRKHPIDEPKKPRTKQCVICGADYAVTRGRQKYCVPCGTERCLSQHRSRHACEHPKPLFSNGRERKHCYDCVPAPPKKPKKPKPEPRRVRRYGCLVEGCQGKHDSLGYCTRHYEHIKRFGEIREDATHCRHCGIEISVKNVKRMYCSKRCATEAWRIANPERTREFEKKHSQQTYCTYYAIYCSDCGEAFGSRRMKSRCDPCRTEYERVKSSESNYAANLKKHNDAGAVVKCKECGIEYCPLYGNKGRDLCFDCARARKRAAVRISKVARKMRQRGVTSEPVNPIKVFERDGWRCHLCRRKTPKSKRGTYADNAPELDHILPISQGGKHAYSNVACCCRKCNWDKGAKPLGQLLLIG
ncbi:HNH endonuclease [Azohydromonas aeria]|uniref:HNH endonuclease n=1 Tax=Azohydromonas aeria TaxID=2590212 RepID=UPI0012FA4948|nr:HNH endonuclease [Azohydromonas aeria]